MNNQKLLAIDKSFLQPPYSVGSQPIIHEVEIPLSSM